MTNRHAPRLCLAASAMLLASPALSRPGPAHDPISYNHFCHRHFEALDAWQRCQELRPKDRGLSGIADPGDGSVWGVCENASRTARGRLVPARMADCLRKAM